MKPLTRPMKACALLGPQDSHDNDSIFKAISALKKWPKIATLKVDGIRAVRTTDLMSCRNKMIPNESIRRRSMSLRYGFDCELFNPELQYDEIESIVMSEEHKDSDKILFWTLDQYSEATYEERINTLFFHTIYHDKDGRETRPKDIVTPAIVWCHSPKELFEQFLYWEQQEGEGICFRTPDSPYKQGRSTLKEEYLIKLCRYERTEVTIVSAYEQMLNRNSLRSTSQGLTERSKALGALVGKDTLGGFWVEDKSGLRFKVGTGVGLTDKRRQELWDMQESLKGERIMIKMKPHGQKVKPRSPVIVDAEYIGRRKLGY